MARKSRRNSRERSSFWSYVLIAFCLVALSGMLTFYFYVTSRPEIGADGCFLDPKLTPAHIVLLVDASDQISPSQKLYVKNELLSMINSAEQGTRFELYVVKEDGTEIPSPVFNACRPIRPDEGSTISSNRRLLERAWRENFESELNNLFEEVISTDKLQFSPIIESIKYISLVSFQRSGVDNKQLVIVSDLLQNTNDFSQYRPYLEMSDFRQTDKFILLRPELDDVDLELLYLRGNSQLQGADHVSWWQEFLSSSGGNVRRIKSLN